MIQNTFLTDEKIITSPEKEKNGNHDLMYLIFWYFSHRIYMGWIGLQSSKFESDFKG